MLTRRAWLLGLVLPAGCSIQPLSSLPRSALPAETTWPAIRAPELGQQWQYRVFNFYNSAQIDTVQEEVTSVDADVTIKRHSARHGELPSEIHTQWGWVQQEPAWDLVQSFDDPLPIWPTSLTLGAATALHTAYRPANASYRLWLSVQSRVAAFERVTVGAGVFDTVRIDKIIRLNHPDSSRIYAMRTDTLWLAPEIGRWVARETNGEYWMSSRKPSPIHEDHLRWELESWV